MAFHITDGTLTRYTEERGVISVIIPKSVTKIKSCAFEWCDSIAYVKIPETVTEIGKGAFYGCENLREIYIGEYLFPYKSVGIFERIHQGLEMIVKKDFSMKMDTSLKYPLTLDFYRKTRDEKAFAYLKKHFTKVMIYLITKNDTEMINFLIQTEKFFTKRNIDKLIDYAIDKNAHEIYVMLLNYKNEHFGYTGIDKRFKL